MSTTHTRTHSHSHHLLSRISSIAKKAFDWQMYVWLTVALTFLIGARMSRVLIGLNRSTQIPEHKNRQKTSYKTFNLHPHNSFTVSREKHSKLQFSLFRRKKTQSKQLQKSILHRKNKTNIKMHSKCFFKYTTRCPKKIWMNMISPCVTASL